MYDDFDQRDTIAIAIAQEDKDLETHGKFLTGFDSKPPFPIVADLGRAQTQRYDRTTTYLIDKKGVVREVFPGTVRTRPSWKAVLNRMDELKVGK